MKPHRPRICQLCDAKIKEGEESGYVRQGRGSILVCEGCLGKGDRNDISL